MRRNILSAELIESRSEKVPFSGCWLWTKSLDPRGYANVRVNDRFIGAHVASYMAFRGAVGKKFVCHRCDVRCCVNPDHLFLGAAVDNMRDMVAKGRDKKAHGENHVNAKLTKEQARSVFFDPRSLSTIAKEYGISVGATHHVKKKRTWKSLWTGDENTQG